MPEAHARKEALDNVRGGHLWMEFEERANFLTDWIWNVKKKRGQGCLHTFSWVKLISTTKLISGKVRKMPRLSPQMLDLALLTLQRGTRHLPSLVPSVLNGARKS